MDAPFSVNLDVAPDDAAIVTVAGEFDIRSADDVAAAAREAERREPSRLVLDLTGVSFMDSVAVAVLVGIRERARERGGRVVVLAGRGPAYDLLSLVGLGGLIEDSSGSVED